MPDEFELSRRKALAALGTVGAASAGTGLGTSAFFRDEETFENNRLAAGELDLKVSWAEHYSDWSEDEAEHAHMEDGNLVIDDREGFRNATLQERFPDKHVHRPLAEVTADPCEVLADVPDDLQRPVVALTDVKPGDFGEVVFGFALCDNPGWIWMTGDLIENQEVSVTEPESDAAGENDDGPLDETEVDQQFGDPDTRGELADAIDVLVWFDPECNDGAIREIPVFRGSLAEALETLSQNRGVLLDGGAGDRVLPDCHASGTNPCVGLRWELPPDRGNATQSDSVRFDLGFYTEQCRHQPQQPEFVDVDYDEICVYHLVLNEIENLGSPVGENWVFTGALDVDTPTTYCWATDDHESHFIPQGAIGDVIAACSGPPCTTRTVDAYVGATERDQPPNQYYTNLDRAAGEAQDTPDDEGSRFFEFNAVECGEDIRKTVRVDVPSDGNHTETLDITVTLESMCRTRAEYRRAV